MDIRELEKKIVECNEAYKNGERLIPDMEYDSLVEQLRTIDPNNALVSKVQNDVPSTNGKKFSFGDRPMLSLNKVYSIDDLIKWMKSVSRDQQERFLLQPKYDGLSCCIDGSSKILSTRGDGHSGEIINSKMPMLKRDLWNKSYDGSLSGLTGCAIDICFPHEGEQYRGEIIIRNDAFDKLKYCVKKRDGEQYKNTRNAVSGLMNPNSSKEDDYEISRKLKEDGIYISFIDHNEIFEVVNIGDKNLAEKIEKTWDFYLKNLPYDQDGLVIKLVDFKYAESLGNTSHHPRGACALKRNNDAVPCKLLGITWTVGSQGELTPTYQIEPTEIGGVVISNVLGHNMKNLQDNDVKIGDNILTCRSGGVIPFSAGYEKGPCHDSISFADNIGLAFDSETGKWLCPCCGSPIIYDPDESPDCYCSNPECNDRIMKRLYNAVSKCFEIKGLAEETLDKLSKKFGIKKFYQLLDLEVSEIQSVEGFAQRSAEILYDSIQKARFCFDVQILASLGIRFIGRSVAKDILTVMTLETLRSSTIEDLVKIKGFGKAKAESLTKGLSDYFDELNELLSRVEYKNTFSVSKKAASEGIPTICFTGEAPYPRSQCQELARKNGYEPISGVNKNLTVLICANKDTMSSKAQKARKYGTKIMSFDEWLASLEDQEIGPVSKENHGNATIDSIIDEL